MSTLLITGGAGFVGHAVIMKRLGWEPRGIEQRLDETVQWYLRHRRKWLYG